MKNKRETKTTEEEYIEKRETIRRLIEDGNYLGLDDLNRTIEFIKSLKDEK